MDAFRRREPLRGLSATSPIPSLRLALLSDARSSVGCRGAARASDSGAARHKRSCGSSANKRRMTIDPLDQLLAAAQAHGAESAPEHEVGDLRAILVSIWNDYEIVANNLFDDLSGVQARKVSDRIPTYALFVDPPLGRVGLTHDQVRATGQPALTSKLMMTKVGRAREMGETAGFMKIAVDAQTQLILGAAIFGVHGDEVVQAVLEVMAAKQPYTVITRGMHIHPTVTELLPTLLEGLAPLV